MVPPLVSHSTSHCAPASCAARDAGQRISRDWPCSRRRNARHRTAARASSRPRLRMERAILSIFSARGISSATSHLEIPGLAHQADGVGTWHPAPGASDGSLAALRPDRLVMPKAVKRARFSGGAIGEEGGVGGIGAGPAAFDVIHAQLSSASAIWRLSSTEKSTPLRLRPVAQGGVEDVQAFAAHRPCSSSAARIRRP